MKTGFLKQVAALEKLIESSNAHGDDYNPSKATLKSAALKSLLASSHQSLKAVVDARINLDGARNIRNQAYNELPKQMTRIVNALAASGASPATVEDAYGYIRKFRSVVKAKMKAASPAGTETPASPQAIRSTSERDFESRAKNFEAFVTLVSREATYQPNEVVLQVATLQARAAELNAINTAVINAQVALNNACAQRDKLLYGANGVHDTAKAVKQYVKGVFGFQSPEYNQIRGLKFGNSKLA